MASKKADRVKSPDEIAQETEFSRRMGLYAAEVSYASGPRYSTATIKACSFELASRTRMLSRGKETSVLYTLPSLDAYEAFLKIPVRKDA